MNSNFIKKLADTATALGWELVAAVPNYHDDPNMAIVVCHYSGPNKHEYVVWGANQMSSGVIDFHTGYYVSYFPESKRSALHKALQVMAQRSWDS